MPFNCISYTNTVNKDILFYFISILGVVSCRCQELDPNHACYTLLARNSFYFIPQQTPDGVFITSDSIHTAFLILSQFQPPPNPDCVNAFKHMMCIASVPPCDKITDRLLPICTKSCLAFTRILEENTCNDALMDANVLAMFSQIKTLVLFVDLLFKFDCDNPSALYLHDNVTAILGNSRDGCTDLLPVNDTG